MELLNQLPESVRGLAWAIFGILVSIGAAFAYLRGKKEGPPKVTEFGITGQLADMSPVKELVEQTGLLVQQQVRTNMVLERVADGLEACAKALKAAADAYAGEIAARATEEEIEERAQLKFEREMERERRARRRAAPRRKPAGQ